MAKGNNSKNNKIGFWGAIRDVSIASMNKGQFPLFIVAALIALMMFKMPAEDVSKLMFTLVGMYKSTHAVGWTLGIISSLGWFLGTKRLRRIHSAEVRRIAEEKKILQKQLLAKTKLGTSNS